VTFQQSHWYLKDLQYYYLDDGFKLVATTDVPCHLWARMTTTPPRKHALPSYRRGLFMQGDIRFCFVVYEDNEQDEAGDTLIHTWHKSAWPICETRWFYFVGTILELPVVSESPIFQFHFPAPPPEPPPPIEKIFIASPDNRTLWKSHGNWATAHNGIWGNIHSSWALPNASLFAGDSLTATYTFWRCAIDFPPLSLPATARIVSAEISLYVTAIYRTDPVRPGSFVTQGVQQLPPIGSDYGAQLPYTTVLGQADIFDLTLDTYNDIPFTDAGLAILDNSAKNRFSLRGQNDVESYISVPRYATWIKFHSQQKGAGYWPLLKVKYYPA